MPLDPAQVAETRAWFRRSRDDLRAGRLDLTATPPLGADACFHAQQAAEKSLKGLLCWHLQPVRKTHDLKELGERCAAIVPELGAACRSVARLTEFAWRFRYPGEDLEPDVAEAAEALALAEQLVQAVLSTLPPDVAP